jgi:hypothetical protein
VLSPVAEASLHPLGLSFFLTLPHDLSVLILFPLVSPKYHLQPPMFTKGKEEQCGEEVGATTRPIKTHAYILVCVHFAQENG